MTGPLTDEQLAGLRALDFLDAAITDFDRACAAVAATRALVREVDRLRAENERLQRLIPKPCHCGEPFKGDPQPHLISCPASGVPGWDDDEEE